MSELPDDILELQQLAFRYFLDLTAGIAFGADAFASAREHLQILIFEPDELVEDGASSKK